jgi:flagellar FliJ protein
MQSPLRCGAYTRAYIHSLFGTAAPCSAGAQSVTQELRHPSDYAAVSTAPSFRFRLERVRALRQRTEDLARQELARAIVQLAASNDRLHTVESHLEQARVNQRLAAGQPTSNGVAAELSVASANPESSTPVDATELLARQAFIEHVEAQRIMGIRELERHQADVADRNTQLGQAAREHRMLERLKERQRLDHEREAARRDSERLDEIALESFRRSAA